MVALADLRAMPLRELEALYAKSGAGPVPSGSYRGKFLRWIDSPGSKKPHIRAIDTVGFRAAPFGIDFDRGRWWFFHPAARMGHFTLSEGPSRWRNTITHRLDYSVSRLPGFVKDLLYDEIKALSPELLLGLGGLNAGAGEGDHFFFALHRA